MNAPARFSGGQALVWTAERIAQLRRHYSAGLTAAESALLLGGVTRNAVISKRHRLGLIWAHRAKPVEIALPPPKARTPRFRAEPVFASWPFPAMDLAPPSDARPKPMAEHQRGECLWPLGPAEAPADWLALFCCAPAGRNRRYCAAHAARARR